MKCFRQLLRQPIKFIAGLILMTVAAAIVCICVGQALAARNTAEQLDKRFTTVVLPSCISDEGEKQALYNSLTLSEEYRQWLKASVQNGSNVIKAVAEHGIISAYIPELIPLNYTQDDFISEDFPGGNRWYYSQTPNPDGMPYTCAMLVITLEEVSDPVELTIFYPSSQEGPTRSINSFGSKSSYQNWLNELGDGRVTAGYSVSLSGTITEVVSLQEGYRDPIGMTARLSIALPSLEDFESLELQPGESYLVYGMDYYDEDWALRGYLADYRNKYPMQIDVFDLRKLRWYTERELQRRYGQGYNPDYRHLEVAMYDNRVELVRSQTDQINAISMQLVVDIQRFSFFEVWGNPEVDLRPETTYTDRDGNTVTLSAKEYRQRYQIPSIMRLEGSVEDFLQSKEGASWQQALERDEINNHAFAVIGVDSMAYLADFAREDSHIAEGRDFTTEEVSNGAKVCIIHEAVAVANGLSVGDTITLNLYHGDPGLPYQKSRVNPIYAHGVLTPSADFYFDTTPILETAEYTIVGTYHSRDLWADVAVNEYAFSPNTVFVPKTSTTTPLEYSDTILFNSVVLYNGMQEEFRLMATEAGFKNPFAYYDQGYTVIVSNFHNYEALAQQVLTVGASVYAVILLLFLILFPGTQGKAVATMESLGATKGKRFAHVMLSSLAIITPATVLGGGLGVMLWQSVVNALQASAEAQVALELEVGVLLLLAVAQFVFALGLTMITAAWVSRSKGLSGRRSK